MSRSTPDPDNLPIEADPQKPPPHSARSIGHSDSSDSGSDLVGDGNPDDDTSDRAGTGERLSADLGVQPDADIGFDRIVDSPKRVSAAASIRRRRRSSASRTKRSASSTITAQRRTIREPAWPSPVAAQFMQT